MSDIQQRIEFVRQLSASSRLQSGLLDTLHLMGVHIGDLDTSHTRTVQVYVSHPGEVLVFAPQLGIK